jgi:hypothetical protein
MNNRCLHGVAGLESSQHDSGPTSETIPRRLRMRDLHKEAHTKTTCGPPQGPGFWAAMRSTFECRRAAPKRDKKTSDQQLGHIFWVAVMGPYGGLPFGTANWLAGESPARTVPSMDWAGKLTAKRIYRDV